MTPGTPASADRQRPARNQSWQGRRTQSGHPEPEDSRERLLRAAARVFARKGFAAAKVDDIAAEAGLSKGAVYWNFDSKDELFLALHDEHIDRRMREMIQLLESPP